MGCTGSRPISATSLQDNPNVFSSPSFLQRLSPSKHQQRGSNLESKSSKASSWHSLKHPYKVETTPTSEYGDSEDQKKPLKGNTVDNFGEALPKELFASPVKGASSSKLASRSVPPAFDDSGHSEGGNGGGRTSKRSPGGGSTTNIGSASDASRSPSKSSESRKKRKTGEKKRQSSRDLQRDETENGRRRRPRDETQTDGNARTPAEVAKPSWHPPLPDKGTSTSWRQKKVQERKRTAQSITELQCQQQMEIDGHAGVQNAPSRKPSYDDNVYESHHEKGQNFSRLRRVEIDGLIDLQNEDFSRLPPAIPRIDVKQECLDFELITSTSFSRIFRCVWNDRQQEKRNQVANMYNRSDSNPRVGNNGRFFALKEVSKHSPHQEAFTKEVQFLATCRHANVMAFYGIYLSDPFSLYFLAELCREDSQTYTERLALPMKQTSGGGVSTHTATFYTRPFGLMCDGSDAVYRVTKVQGQAEMLKVKPGMRILTLNNIDVENANARSAAINCHRTDVLEYFKHCPLPVTLSFSDTRVWDGKLLNLIRDFLSTVRFLHVEKRIVHGDFKPGNVLIDIKGTMKLCDFGSAIQAPDGAPSNNASPNEPTGPSITAQQPQKYVPFLMTCSCGTVGFRAPEVTDPTTGGYDGFAADIYSAGKTMELWTKNTAAKPPALWDYASNPAVKWMITEMTQDEASYRPRIGYVLSSIFEDMPFETTQ